MVCENESLKYYGLCFLFLINTVLLLYLEKIKIKIVKKSYYTYLLNKTLSSSSLNSYSWRIFVDEKNIYIIQYNNNNNKKTLNYLSCTLLLGQQTIIHCKEDELFD